MTMKAEIWMPLYIGDYLADTAYLTTEQHGAYLLLIMAYWRNGPPPDNDGILASLTKMTPDAWSIARAVLERYFVIDCGVWIHARIEREIEKAKKNRTSAHDKAARAAAARWGKENEKKMLGALPEALHAAMPQQCPSPSPSPLPKQEHKNTDQEIEQAYSPPPPKVPKALDWSSWPSMPSAQVMADWVAARKAKRAPTSQTVITQFGNELRKAGAMGYSVDQCLADCITSGWQGFKAEWIANRNKTGGTNGQSGRPERESVSARAVREAAEFIADLDAAERIERDQEDGGGGVYENELAIPWQGVGGLPGAR